LKIFFIAKISFLQIFLEHDLTDRTIKNLIANNIKNNFKKTYVVVFCGFAGFPARFWFERFLVCDCGLEARGAGFLACDFGAGRLACCFFWIFDLTDGGLACCFL
jgi:hypothetical protein